MNAKKHATLNNYILGKTLGSGYHAKVKLATVNGNQVACKIFKSNHSLASNMKTLKQEIGVMQQLNHPNLVNLVEVVSDGTYTKKNGDTYKALGIVLEYCAGGELFEYVAQSGRFSEEVARAYFHQLINGLEYLHTHNISHRDLKPENLLFDSQFNLKIADFGFATLMEGKDGNGLLKTCLGTESYMAPEIHAKTPYNGASVDLFAAAIILFIMYAGTPPFSKADPKDPYYKLLCSNRHDTFWQAHLKNKGSDKFFSQSFMDFTNSLFASDAVQRLSLAEIKNHPWYKGPVATTDQIKQQFLVRYNTVQAAVEKDRLAKQETKLKEKAKEGGNAVFAGANKFRSGGEDQTQEFAGLEQAFNLQGAKRALRDAEEGDDNTSGLKSAADAEYLFKYLLKKHGDFCQKAEPSDKYFKIKFFGTDSDQIPVEFSVEIKKIDEEINVLDFQRQSGQPLSYFEIVNKIKNQIAAL